LLFLGAGSSTSFNVPTMGTFVDDIAKSLQGVNPVWSEEIKSMKRRLVRRNIKPDIEIIMTALSILSDSEETGSYKLPFLAMTETNIVPRHELSELLNSVKEQIYKRCLASNIDKATRAYDKLFKALQDIGHAEFITVNGKKIERLQSTGFSYNSERHQSIVDKIFTTNYDPIIEASIRNMNRSYSDGFYVDDQGDLSFQNQWDQQKDYELIKLHGSLDYYSKDSRKSVKYALDSISPNRNIYGENLERMMILPIGEKYVTRSPYIDLLNKLRVELFKEEVVVAIGYSFRDIPINNALEERVAMDEPHFQMFVVAPDSDQIIKDNIPPTVQKISTPINASFDDIDQSIEIISNGIYPSKNGNNENNY
jgi:hypothetical protein